MNNRAPKAHTNNWCYIITRECRTVKPIFRKANTINIHLFVYSPPAVPEKEANRIPQRCIAATKWHRHRRKHTDVKCLTSRTNHTRAPTPSLPPSLRASTVKLSRLQLSSSNFLRVSLDPLKVKSDNRRSSLCVASLAPPSDISAAFFPPVVFPIGLICLCPNIPL